MSKLKSLFGGVVLAALVLGSGAFAVADGDEAHRPQVDTTAATQVSDRSARLTAQVKHMGSDTTYRFEYGPTRDYGYSTAAGTIVADGNNSPRAVGAVVSGLAPGTEHHFRIRATNDDGTETGEDSTFRTAPAAAEPAVTPGVSAAIPPSTQAPAPRLGDSVLVAPLQGTIKIKRSGSAGYVTLAAGDSVPVGSLVDARRGTVKLTSSLGAGNTQSGEFRGALFMIRQARTGNGMTDLVLRGSNFAGCPRATNRAARHKRKRPKRRLFGRDKGGRFRTHGHNSVATVRGTSWVTTDTCAGTRTTVKEGSMSVRDRHRNKTIIVRAGHSYLARSKR